MGVRPYPGSVTQYNMIFGSSANVNWTVPNDWPQIATADGGVIGYSGITYDQNGIATGQIGGVPTKGWFGDSYNVAADSSLQSVNPIPVNPATSLWAFLGGSPSGKGTSAKDAFRLGGPTSTLNTLDGGPLFKCDDGPGIFVQYWGYQRCEQYTVLDHESPPKPIKRTGIGFDEKITDLETNYVCTGCDKTGSGATHKGGILWDNLAIGTTEGAAHSPQKVGGFAVRNQVITLHKTGATVRVNCIDFEPTDVTVTDITDNPQTQCTRH
jgi:hypothetical protein